MSRRDNFEHLEKENREFREINAKLLEACKGIAVAVFEEPPLRSARWGNAFRVLEAAIAEAEAKQG